MEKRTNIFEPTSCLSDEQLLRYAKGEMNAAEKRVVELHLADCEMCSDAVEGLMMMEQSKLKSIQAGMNEQIDALTVNRGAKIISIQRRWYMSAAAVVLLTIGTYFIFKTIQSQKNQTTVSEQFKSTTNDSNIQLNTLSSQPTQSAIVTDTVFSANENLQQKAVVSKQEIMSNKNVAVDDANEELASKEREDVVVAFDEKNAGAVAAPVSVEMKKPENDKYLFADSVVSTGSIAEKDMQSTTFSSEEVTVQSGKKKERKSELSKANTGFTDNYKAVSIDMNQYNAAIELYNQKQYTKALGSFNILLNQNPQHLGCLYYAGMCNYNLNNFSLAAQQLELASANKATEFYESALWHEANALIKLNDNKQAKRTLEKVVKFNGNYKSNAEELLKTLK